MSESTTSASAKFAHWAAAGRRGLAVTGASSWIGRAMVHVAAGAAPDLTLRLFASADGALTTAAGSFPLESLASARPLSADREWMVLHLAVAGVDREADPERLRALNDSLLQRAFGLAEGVGVRRFVSASSGAANQLGQGSPEQRAYAALKHEQEAAARAWAAAAGAPLLIPRIFNVGGPYVSHPGRRALADFIHQARTTRSVHIGAARPVIRSYVHVLELARVTFDLALSDAEDLLFETAGPQAVELDELARAIGRALSVDVQVRRPPMTSQDADRYVGDGAVYQAALAAMGSPPVGLDRIIRDTAEFLADDAR
jgi:nucleoside-diphosphate-sugar epimerase